MQSDINQALNIYLGTGETGGYSPLNGEQRLRQAFPHDYHQIFESIARYLKEDRQPDWSKRTLAQETALFADTLRLNFPELDDASISALANRWSFGWK